MQPATIWIDVEDVLAHLGRGARPTGIQRLALEVAAALVELAGPRRIRFVRHAGPTYAEVGYDTLHRAYAASVAGPGPAMRILDAETIEPADQADPAAHAPARLRGQWHHLARRLPGDVRIALLDVLLPQWAALRAVPRLAGAIWQSRPRRGEGAQPYSGPAPMAAGETLLELAAPWATASDGRALTDARARGVRSAAVIYDLIPLLRPEYGVVSVARRLRAWALRELPRCDVPLAISQATLRDIAAFAAREGIQIDAPIRIVPIGTGLADPAAAAPPPGLPTPGSYVLFVATLEVRKNHAQLLRIWRRLIDTAPAPRLVFAGAIGWLVGDLMQQLRNSRFLDGHVTIIERPSDAALAALYRGAMFTIYPSLYEGWGLPVVESLAAGTPCLAARTSSLPEAGGDLARYFAAGDDNDALRMIRDLLENPAELANWAAEIRARFRPVPWQETARAILAAIDA